jgi:hypothetical protein
MRVFIAIIIALTFIFIGFVACMLTQSYEPPVYSIQETPDQPQGFWCGGRYYLVTPDIDYLCTVGGRVRIFYHGKEL